MQAGSEQTNIIAEVVRSRDEAHGNLDVTKHMSDR